MNSHAIDEAIERYVKERMTAGRVQASTHFICYAHLTCARNDIKEFMQQVKKMSCYYIDMLKVLENPFRGLEMAFFLSMVSVAIFSCWLMHEEDTRLSGILVFAGTIVHLWALLTDMLRKWQESGVLIAIYEEIASLAEQEARVLE